MHARSAPQAAVAPTGRQILAGLLFAVAILVAFVLISAITEEFPGGEASPLVISFFLGVAEALLIIPPWFFLVRHGGSWTQMGLRDFRWRDLAVGFSLLVLSILFNFAWAVFLALLGLEIQPDILPLFGGGGTGFVLALIVGGAVAPLAEEIYFRAFLFVGFRERWGLGWGLIASSILFALFHFLPTGLLPISLLGIILAITYQLSGSLWPSILMHAATNVLALTATYLSTPAA